MSNCRYEAQVHEIIINNDTKTLVDTAQKIAKDIVVWKMKDNKPWKVDDAKSVSTSQIRNIFSTSKKIQMALKNGDEKNIESQYAKLLLMKPKLAYVCGRFDKIRGLQMLRDCLSSAIDQIDGDYDRMQNFFNFFEAILAYHKAEGGK